MTQLKQQQRIQLDIGGILQILPHRHPLVMVDRITQLVPWEYVEGRKAVAYNEPWFAGHFPKRPMLPGVLILEALMQIGSILAYVSDPFPPEAKQMYFLGVDKAKFRKPVLPGDLLQLRCDVIHKGTNVWKLTGEASVEGTLCAQAELLASIVDKEG